MAVTRTGYGVTAVEIEILIAVARVDPYSFAAFCGDRHFLVSGELELMFVCCQHKTFRQDLQDFQDSQDNPLNP